MSFPLTISSDHTSHPRRLQALARRAHPIRPFPARPIPQCHQRSRYRLHPVHNVLPAMAGHSAPGCIVDELDDRDDWRCAAIFVLLVVCGRAEELYWSGYRCNAQQEGCVVIGWVANFSRPGPLVSDIRSRKLLFGLLCYIRAANYAIKLCF
jgi:hypothetical protein